MFNYFRNILSAANDKDPASVRLLRVVLTASVLAAAAAGILLFLTDFKLGIGTIGAATLSLLTGVLLFLSFRNLYWPGRLLMPLVLLVAFTFIAISVDGLHGSTTAGFVLVIVLASLLSGQKIIPLATLLTLLGVWIVAYTDMTGINTSVFAQRTDWAYVVVVSVIQVVAAASLNGLMARLNSALDMSRANEQAQIKSNEELRDLQTVLEQRVAERTHSLELAAEVGRSVSRVRELGPMLKEAAEIIRSRFSLYYVQVYLANPAQNALLLQSGTGTIGAELVGRGHRLPLDISSINGRAAVEKRSVVIADTTSSSTFRPNPLLPETRSEMAVPLMVGEKVVGVLDLQGHLAGALSEEILPAFEALAGQLAIAIQNASLLAETEQARAEVEKQARRLVRANWEAYQDAIHKPEQTGFMFEGNTIVPLAEGLQPLAEDNAISAPIAVTGQQLGSLVVEMSTENQSPQNVELVNSVARQVAQQVENLRLLESAERYRTDAEQASRRLTLTGWQEYADANASKGLSYMYDLNEVLPQDGKQQIDASAVNLPLKVRDETIGRLVVQGMGAEDVEALDLANTVAERLSAHIESLRQQDQTQSALAQSSKLFEVSSRLTQATDLQELVAVTVATLNVANINRAILATINYDPNGNPESLDVLANWWNGSGREAAAVGTHYPYGIFSTMATIISPVPVFYDDVWNDKSLDSSALELLKRQNIRAIAVLPLHLGSTQIGIMLLESEEPRNFTQGETRLFSSLAPQIATLLENRRQFERAQKQAERETMLNTIGQKIRAATSVDAVLQIAARELGHALGAPLTIAQLGLKEKK